ncbi:hypothetical protein [Desulfovibrio legallii]|jgi:hypothetical protein|uniref:Uncharacterized protein n=1 Tax=Desulfovibrio legallii TaxID=571438 RepID=A0A1G7PIK4_9BACT|nr:hypothetical protein [Desulfovibrio legallii]SDF86071.1 hypothetical protein SAMN05192586_11626 [Desulfovibrio legallii]
MAAVDARSTVFTPYGPVYNIHILARWPDGTPRDCRCLGPDTVATPQGWLPPLYAADDIRRTSDRSFSLYPNGMWRSLELQTQCPVPTPLGELPVEWLSWFPNGALKRILLRKGKTSGYWTEEDEGRLANVCALSLPTGPVEAKVQGLRFHPSGRCASVTFWPGERLTLPSALGPLPVRNGCAFYASGALRSCEPARPLPVPTPAGLMVAFDPTATAICGDVNSLQLTEEGAVCGLTTTARLRWTDAQGPHTLTPRLELDQLTMRRTVVVPLHLTFTEDGRTRIDDGRNVRTVSTAGLTAASFTPLPDLRLPAL